jgi:Myb/SANT-like DNA-binding domain
MAAEKRTVNFTEQEKIVLVREIQERGNILHGEFSATLTKSHKERAWEMVAQAVNAVAPIPRTIKSVSRPKLGCQILVKIVIFLEIVILEHNSFIIGILGLG